MPPKKDQLSKVDLRRKAYEHGIRFEGPTPPKLWPNEHKHHFQAIRSIQFTQYDDYKDNKHVSINRRETFQKRVNYLRRKAKELLDDVNTNEATWRELEHPILERFDKLVICGNCNNELWKSDHEAECLHEENQIKLNSKRHLRRMCFCKNRRVEVRTENSDDENGTIFRFAKDEVITHALGDDLQNFNISMKPDRVIGLRAPSNMPQNYSYFPVTGRGILLPFLIVEAKKGGVVPGFRSIQYQTAFPVRRLLKAQYDLGNRSSSCEPCLVWFFAYQGEQWRLHAGSQEHGKVRIYDLWQGTIQSQDGALQLLLIVDYIWSWARDVYRPTIRELILDSITGIRDLSPASTDRFRHSISLSSVTSPAPTIQDLDQMQIDEGLVATERSIGLAQEDGYQSHQYEDQEVIVLRDARSHTFLQWAVGQNCSPSWTKLGSIRHSDIIHFEFRCYDAQRCDTDIGQSTEVEDDDDDLLLSRTLSSWALPILPEQLNELATLWTVNFAPNPTLDLRGPLQATLFCQTYCDQSTWQIKRVLNCILWRQLTLEPATTANIACLPTYGGENDTLERLGTIDFKSAILHSRNIQGRESVRCALQGVSMVLQPRIDNVGLDWTLFAQTNLPENASETLMGLAARMRLGDIDIHHVTCCGGLSQIDSNSESHLPSILPASGQGTQNGDSMLAIRLSSWPSTCPMFCLFVLSQKGYDSVNILHRLLEEAISAKDWHGDSDYKWRPSDWQILREWREALRTEEWKRATITTTSHDFSA